MLAPITHPIPPSGYGPWEQVVSDLTRGLTDVGHDVTLFGPVGSDTPGHLVATVPHPLDEWPSTENPPDHRVWEEIHIAAMAESASARDFDIIHSHLNVHPLGYARLLDTPMITTLHGSAWNRGIHPALDRFKDLPFVSLSNSERAFFPGLNYVATVHNGIDCARFGPGPGDGGFLLFAGRMAPEKQPHLAVEVGRLADTPVKFAGPIEDRHRAYFESEVAPGLDGAMAQYVGDLERGELADVYGKAAAVIVPLAWDEPFGLVVVESLASGTPVVGWRRGALPELIEDRVTGFLVDDVPGAVSAVKKLDDLDRAACRQDAVARFSISAMTDGYIDAYQRVLAG
jgi:glycosyltransferase involved in cell wall biosynthesis